MFTRRFKLFRLMGFDVHIDLSWFIIVILISWSLATALFPENYADLSTATYWWMGIAGALGLFVSIVLHELGHSLVARRFGLPMKGITLFIFGGVAEMSDEPPSAKAEFLVAIAGPIVSILISLSCYGLNYVGETGGWPVPVVGVLWYLSLINAIVVGFNLIPAFPLDGGRVLRSLLWSLKGSLRWATRITSSIGAGFGLVLILLGVLNFIGGNIIGGMWQVLIGMFLRGAAQMSYQQVLIRRALEGEPVSRFMQTNIHTVRPSATIEEFVNDYIYKHHHKMFPITDNGTLQGCVTISDVKEVPREEWSHRSVGEIAESCTEANTIGPDIDAMEALSKMSQDGTSRLMVVQDKQLQGVVTLKDMLQFISLKVELENDKVPSNLSRQARQWSAEESAREEQFTHA